jgi:sugar-specific transcriptional regulator TrmB
MADFLTKQRAEIDKRLRELKPLYDEYLTLERAREALEGVAAPRRGPGRPAGSRTRKATTAKRRRRRRGGTRREQALKLVKSNPGITVGDLAKQLRIRQNYLYRVMGELRDEGAVKKQGRGYKAA